MKETHATRFGVSMKEAKEQMGEGGRQCQAAC